LLDQIRPHGLAPLESSGCCPGHHRSAFVGRKRKRSGARIVRQVSDEEAIHFPECEIHRF
jgi:hypothetical protein